jgi:ribosomal protein L40E
VPSLERPCVDCGSLTAHVVIDGDAKPPTMAYRCTRCASEGNEQLVDELADHPQPIVSSEWLDAVPCPECGAPEGLFLPVGRPAASALGVEASVRGGGLAICVECKARVPWGPPEATSR